jgi:hypothetical protein
LASLAVTIFANETDQGVVELEPDDDSHDHTNTLIPVTGERGYVSAFCDFYRQLLDCIESALAMLPLTATGG